MVGTVVAAGDAESEALSLARDIASRGPVAVRAAKEAIDGGLQVRYCTFSCVFFHMSPCFKSRRIVRH